MKKLFIQYNEALSLKELDFDEECLMYWNDFGASSTDVRFSLLNKIDEESQDYYETPTYQQAFDWFREKYNLCSWVYMSNARLYHYSILKDNRLLVGAYLNFITYEEARSECLKKLIELCKKK